MLGITKHIKLLSSAAILLFAFGSSGLTIVLHYCTMPEMACCMNMDDDAGSASSQTGTAAVQSDMACNSTTLVGGFTTNAGIVDNNKIVQKLTVDVLPASDVLANTLTIAASLPVLPFTGNVSPPSVDKHILNASLLI